MQKAIRINLTARNQMVKKVRKDNVRMRKGEWAQWHQAKQETERAHRKYVREERAHRREDWLCGPLAPDRNTGTDKGSFGAVDLQALQQPEVPRDVRSSSKVAGYTVKDWEGKDKERKFKGRTIVGNVVVNDRVAIVHGPERLRGIVATVSTVDLMKEEVVLRNVNTIDVRLPGYALADPPPDPENPDQPPLKFQTIEVPIPMSWLRLVVDIPNAQGEMTTTLVRHVHADEPYLQREYPSNLPPHTRYVTGVLGPDGQPIPIPWPEEDFGDKGHQAPADTSSKIVDDHTWNPTIISSPLGYNAEVNLDNIASPDDRYTAGLVDNPKTNAERTGIHAFVDQKKLDQRRDRITAGIMEELFPKTKRNISQHVQPEWVKKKILEDARAIWWRDRQLSLPSVQAVELAAARKKQALMARVEPEQRTLPQLVMEMQRVTVGDRYSQADTRWGKELSRMGAPKHIRVSPGVQKAETPMVGRI